MTSSRTIRKFVVVAALAAFLCVSLVAATPAHWHSNVPGNTCDLCALAHFPAFAAPLPVTVDVPAIFTARGPAFFYSPVSEGFNSIIGSRGPPR